MSVSDVLRRTTQFLVTIHLVLSALLEDWLAEAKGGENDYWNEFTIFFRNLRSLVRTSWIVGLCFCCDSDPTEYKWTVAAGKGGGGRGSSSSRGSSGGWGSSSSSSSSSSWFGRSSYSSSHYGGWGGGRWTDTQVVWVAYFSHYSEPSKSFLARLCHFASFVCQSKQI